MPDFPQRHPTWVRYTRLSVLTYATVIESVDDEFLCGIAAHDLLPDTNDAKALFDLLVKWANPTIEFRGDLIRRLSQTKVQDFDYPLQFVAFVDVIRTCVETRGASEALTTLLVNAINDMHPEIALRAQPMNEDSWYMILREIRHLPTPTKVEAHDASDAEIGTGEDTDGTHSD